MKNQYDEFLHKIQQAKMKELWDNKKNEAWEHAWITGDLEMKGIPW